MEDDPKSGRPTTNRTNENVERVREKVHSDCRLTVRMIADELSMNSEEGVEDHYRRSGDEEGLCENGTKVAE